MSDLFLDSADRRALRGELGAARRTAMEMVVEMAELVDAERLIDIESAHIDACLPFGQVALDLPTHFLDEGGRVAVPTTLNVSALDLLHPERPSGDPAMTSLGRQIVSAYEALGCQTTWTCAPYQLPVRPAFGSHVAWAESNAIVFANSVLGARTNRYGDFFDVCAAIAGRVPETGLHVSTNRRASVLLRLRGFDRAQLASDLLYPLLGLVVGERSGARIPVIEGLPPKASEDQLKALGAAAASSGAVAMFHALGITPEAGTLEQATHRIAPELVLDVTPEDLRQVRRTSPAATTRPLSAVAVGTPHFSRTEFESLRSLLAGRRVHPTVHVYAATGRETLAWLERRGWAGELSEQGVTIVTDTCTYLRPMFDFGPGTVLTNSAKWAWYAPMTVGREPELGSLHECVESAVAGRLELDDVF